MGSKRFFRASMMRSGEAGHNTLKPQIQHVETVNSTCCLFPFDTLLPLSGGADGKSSFG